LAGAREILGCWLVKKNSGTKMMKKDEWNEGHWEGGRKDWMNLNMY
jgi:hypothetical protein